MKKKSVRLLTPAMLIMVFFSVVLQAQPVKISFMPHWLPQAQFAGYYAAVAKGFYSEENLDVTVLTGGPDAPSFDYLQNDKAQLISAFLSGAIQARDMGIPLVNVAQLTQKSALLFVTRKKNGEKEKLIDLNAKRIGIWRTGFQEIPLSFLHYHHIEPERIVPINATISLFFSGGIDAMCVMWYNEYHQLYAAGIDTSELNTFFLGDYGFDIPEDGIYCKEEFLQKNPDVVSRFVKATLKGWKWAFDHEEETLDLVIGQMKEHNVPYNRAHQRWMLRRMKDLMYKDGQFCQPLTKESYHLTNEILFDNRLIQCVRPYSQFCPRADHDSTKK